VDLFYFAAPSQYREVVAWYCFYFWLCLQTMIAEASQKIDEDLNLIGDDLSQKIDEDLLHLLLPSNLIDEDLNSIGDDLFQKIDEDLLHLLLPSNLIDEDLNLVGDDLLQKIDEDWIHSLLPFLLEIPEALALICHANREASTPFA
jgi:N-dimethylarginine dimethylaminohydrolase